MAPDHIGHLWDRKTEQRPIAATREEQVFYARHTYPGTACRAGPGRPPAPLSMPAPAMPSCAACASPSGGRRGSRKWFKNSGDGQAQRGRGFFNPHNPCPAPSCSSRPSRGEGRARGYSSTERFSSDVRAVSPLLCTILAEQEHPRAVARAITRDLALARPARRRLHTLLSLMASQSVLDKLRSPAGNSWPSRPVDDSREPGELQPAALLSARGGAIIVPGGKSERDVIELPSETLGQHSAMGPVHGQRGSYICNGRREGQGRKSCKGYKGYRGYGDLRAIFVDEALLGCLVPCGAHRFRYEAPRNALRISPGS